jgi:5-methylcytosine-specific restriction endonuclease McrA
MHRVGYERRSRDEIIAHLRRRADIQVGAHSCLIDTGAHELGWHLLTPAEWLALCELHDWSCAYCGIRVERIPGVQRLVIEHMVPLGCRDGLHVLENVVPACPGCNVRKGDLTALEFMLVRHGLWRRTGRGNCRRNIQLSSNPAA